MYREFGHWATSMGDRNIPISRSTIIGLLKRISLRVATVCTGDRPIPSCLFIDPELAQVGLTETAARQQGYDIQVAKLDASAIPRARTLGQIDGFLKAIVDAKTDRILGCSLFCHAAGEMISTVQMVMQAEIPYTVLRDGVLTHPTMTEGLNLLFSKL